MYESMETHSFTEKNIEQVPEEHGIFTLWNDKDDIIYIGSSSEPEDSLRKRLKDHKNRSYIGRKEYQAKRFHYEVTKPEDAKRREQELMREYFEYHKRLPLLMGLKL